MNFSAIFIICKVIEQRELSAINIMGNAKTVEFNTSITY